MPLAIVLILVMSIFPVSAHAQTSNLSTAVSVTPVESTLLEGKDSIVNVVISSPIPNRGVEFSLTYDPQLIQVRKISEGDYYRQWALAHGGSTTCMPGLLDNQAGTLTGYGLAILGGGKGGPTGSGTAFSISVTAVSNVNGISDLVLSGLILKDANAEDIADVTLNHGQLQISRGTTNIPHKDLKSSVRAPAYIMQTSTLR